MASVVCSPTEPKPDGGGDGGGAHALDEWFDTKDSHQGTQWALLYLATLAGVK